MNDDERVGNAISRRSLLRGGIGLGAFAGLAGCAKYHAPGAGKGTGRFAFPAPAHPLPKGKVTYRLIDSGDTKKPYWDALFDAYHKKHQNITIQYDGLPRNRMDEIIPLGIRNGTAHDVFGLPPSITVQKAYGEGWISPMDDVLADVDALKKSLPAGTLTEGIHLFDGKLYELPMGTEQRYSSLLHYNRKLMQEAGYDPAEKRLTWDQYRDAARKITKKGDGRVYGVVLEIGQPERLVYWVDYMARTAGAAAFGGIQPTTGEFYFTRPEVLDALEMLLTLKRDKSLFPGSNTLLAPECWPRVPRGSAGMVSAGPWVAVLWEDQNPNFEFDVAEHPTPDDKGDPVPIGYTGIGSDGLHLFSKSKLKNVSGDVLSYVLSEAGQTRMGEFTKAGNPPILESARKAMAKKLSPQGKRCLAIADTMVLNPEVAKVNPDVGRVNSELRKPALLDYGEVIQAVLVGEEDNPKKALAALQDRSNKNLDDALAAARKKGAKVSRSDYVFKNFDPRKDYLPADYKGR